MDNYFLTMRGAHAGQALDIKGLCHLMPVALETGNFETLEKSLICIYKLKTGLPVACIGRIGAILGDGTKEQVEAIGRYYDVLGVAFQITDDVLNLQGFENNFKIKGEDISEGKITLPLIRGLATIPDCMEREHIWQIVTSKTQDVTKISYVCEKLESVGTYEACLKFAREMVEEAWCAVDPLLEDNIHKIMMHALGQFLISRHV